MNDSFGMTAIPGQPDSEHLIDRLLLEQSELTAVERFSQHHDENAESPLRGRYSSLIPVSTPRPGEQYAFEVDLDRCSGCKACVAACHVLNGLDDDEAWRDVGMIVGAEREALPVIQHVTSSCHHCLDPACMSACPVNAYEKDPVTGIVRHLDDQCFGCQYCTLACPFDAPKFHAAKGIVRKCDMCHDRLATGEAPACVQACPHEAISIRLVEIEEVASRAKSGLFLEGAPEPSYTRPTTRYITRREQPSRQVAADHFQLRAEHVHWPLVVLLVFTQLSVGGFLSDLLGRGMGWPVAEGRVPLLVLSLLLGFVGLGASLLHLGRPLYAYRAILGLGHSWLSREAVVLGLFAQLAVPLVSLEIVRPSLYTTRPVLSLALSIATGIAGIFGVTCSITVYHVVRRPLWTFRRSATAFYGTTIVLGLAVVVAVSAWFGKSLHEDTAFRIACACLAAATTLKLAFESLLLGHCHDPEWSPMKRSALLLGGLLARWVSLRLFLAVVGGVVTPLILMLAGSSATPTFARLLGAMAFVVVTGGEVVERALFFAAVIKPKMPGGLQP